jgi:hypothetical protein
VEKTGVLFIAVFLTLATAFVTDRVASAQSPPAEVPAPAKLPENLQSELVDDPVAFRLIQLAFVEESLQAVDAAMQKASGQANTSAKKVEYYDKNNEKMDRQGGGPVPWFKFYGRSPERFFHTGSTQGQRPPQFDYIYRANEQQAQKAKDQIASLGGKIDKLRERKRSLEQEQVALWTRISAAMVAKCEFRERPLYTRHLIIEKAGELPAEVALNRAKAIEALTEYVRIVDSSLEKIDGLVSADAISSFKLVKQNADNARYAMVKELSGISDRELTSKTDSLADLAKRLAVTAASAMEVYQSSIDADKAGDEHRRLSSRGLLQTAIFDLADKSNTLDEGIIKLAEEWKVQPAMDRIRPEITLVGLTPAANVVPQNATNTDKLLVGSVWSGIGPQGGYRFTLEVLSRDGEKFTARYRSDALGKRQRNEGEFVIEGSVGDGRIEWHKQGDPNDQQNAGTISADELAVRMKKAKIKAPLILRLQK